MSHKSSKQNRRAFLKQMLTGSAAFYMAPPMVYFIESLLKNAIAQSSGVVAPRKLISIQQAQAPARWMFDMFLTPYASASELASFNPQNQMIATRFAKRLGRNEDLIYATVKAHGINAPYMWSFDIPTRSGSRPMTDLLPFMLSLQGINTTNAGHSISRQLHFLPAGSEQSIGALSSDYTDHPLGNVALQVGNFAFKSIKNKSPLVAGFSNGNYIQQLLTPFIISKGKNLLDSKRGAAATNFEQMSRLIDQHAVNGNSKFITSILTKSSASELMQDGFSDLSTVWTERLNVYKSLIQRALDQSIIYPGINDAPVGSLDVASRDLRYALNSGDNIVRYSNLSDAFSSPALTARIAENMVVAEFLILNDLSSSVCINIGGLQGLKIEAGMNTSDGMAFDEHNNGSMFAALGNFWYNRAVAACLLELITELSSKNLASGKSYFEETIIELYGEFQRSPRIDGSGSDHGSLGKSVMYLSGSFEGPCVVGALGRNPVTDVGAPGVWGQGTVDPNIGKHVTNADMAATLAHLLRVPSPFRTTSPMVTVDDNGVIKPIASLTRVLG